MRTLYCLCFLITATNLPAQTILSPAFTFYPGMCAYSAFHADAFSFISNQASLTQMKRASAGVYAQRKFLLNELPEYNAVLVLPTQAGNFGFKTAYSGFGGYNESQIGLAYAHNLGNKAAVGVQFNYNTIHISGYGNASAPGLEAGLMLHLSDKLHSGIHVNNPVGGKFGTSSREKLPSVYTIGLGYDASEKFYFTAAISKEEDSDVIVNAGIHYLFTTQLVARGGVSTSASSLWIGLGVYFNSLRLDVTTAYHAQLGISPGLLLLFYFKDREKQAE